MRSHSMCLFQHMVHTILTFQHQDKNKLKWLTCAGYTSLTWRSANFGVLTDIKHSWNVSLNSGVEIRVNEFLSTFICSSHACIIQRRGVRSPPYTSKARAMSYIMNYGTGIDPEGGILYILVPWSDEDVSIAYYYDEEGNFEEL